MSRNIRVYLNDILEGIEQIKDYVKKLTFDKFSKDRKTIDAVIRNLELIGEAVKFIPQKVKSKYIYDWRGVVGLRDILIHAYFGINIEILWDIIQNELPAFKKIIKEILEKEQFENNSVQKQPEN